ncbi:ATP synthase F1 subunit gamma [Garciella nitratireducens]|uniref:ATP synthase gamma chain n=1 Tax=Garciella nitratireducens DSM 15102 TaxID=1121911 RepID=A0A1T4MLD7_9FIRM|nr:ATP synthase F1 subunit gamma [Garciella nitratireducens]RBP37809.1 ATP synthase F1 subcomplex gamma subunit [Garciella nitratireducens]SJZ67584.1 ATP synthase F1 subcomplex gamma subunit [Garciella nitratireducens DSM 15102]
MTQGTRDIKRRIRSIESTKQITKAMEMVAASKLRRAREKAESGRPYFEKLVETVREIVEITGRIDNPFMEIREGKNKAFIVVTADRGLAGGYNSAVIQEAVKKIEDKENTTIISFGSKGRDYFKRRNYNIVKEYIGISEEPDFAYARDIGKRVMDLFLEGKIDEVYIIYTKFISTLTQKPQVQRILPIKYEDSKRLKENEKKDRRSIIEYEPSEEGVLNHLIPSYIYNTIYGALVESAASQQAARKVAMEAATDNANEIIDDLSLTYNRARQGAITQELTEIVSSAEALK